MTQPTETVFYDEGGVRITSARAVMDGTTYPLANISSVGTGVISPNMTSGGLLLIAGVIALIAGFAGGDPNWIVIVLGVIIGAAGLLAARSAKATYFVKLGSAGGEQRALLGRDKATVEKIVTALNDAIIKRG